MNKLIFLGAAAGLALTAVDPYSPLICRPNCCSECVK